MRTRRLPLLFALLIPTACESFGDTGAADPGERGAGFEPTEVYSHGGVGGTTERGQGFTMEKGGEIVALDLWIKGATKTAPLEVRILPVDADGAPLSEDQAIASATVEGGEVPERSTWFTVSFDAHPTVASGDKLAWTVASPSEEDWNYGLLGGQVDTDGAAYDGGKPCDRAVGNYEWKSCHSESSGSDEGFVVWMAK